MHRIFQTTRPLDSETGTGDDDDVGPEGQAIQVRRGQQGDAEQPAFLSRRPPMSLTPEWRTKMTSNSLLTLQSTIMRLLSQPNVDRRLGRGRHYFTEAVMNQFPAQERPTPELITQVLWSLIGKGLVYIDIEQPAPENWSWRLTNAGAVSAKDEQFNPDDPERYLLRLRSNIPAVSDLVFMYAGEAVRCYTHECYLASAVMLGVASEAAFLEMAQASVNWLEAAGQKLQAILDKPRQPYVKKFEEFRKRIEPRKSELSTELTDGMSLTFDSVLDLLRISRNEAGHPTGKSMLREDQYISLQMFGRYIQKLYALKAFFLQSTRKAG